MTFNQSLASLYQKRLITLEEAVARSSDPDELKNMLGSSAGARAAGAPVR